MDEFCAMQARGSAHWVPGGWLVPSSSRQHQVPTGGQALGKGTAVNQRALTQPGRPLGNAAKWPA